jgi:hypothetical protein
LHLTRRGSRNVLRGVARYIDQPRSVCRIFILGAGRVQKSESGRVLEHSEGEPIIGSGAVHQGGGKVQGAKPLVEFFENQTFFGQISLHENTFYLDS